MPENQNFDLSLYFIADPSMCGGRDVVEVTKAAIRGGVRMVQYRDKSGRSADIVLHDARRVGKAVREAAEETGRHVTFIVNDHVELAHQAGADGVHLGQGDGDPAAARALLGARAIIGVTAFEPDHFEAIKAMPEGTIDYAGTGPFFQTSAKTDKPVLGAARFSELVSLSPVPVVGIGGITPERAPEVMAAGASGVAVMSAISMADDPEAAARGFVGGVGKHD